MHYTMTVALDFWHKPTETWATPVRFTHGLRAVGTKHALDKALRVAVNTPVYKDRAADPDWTAHAEVGFAEETA